jgi:hypothetical protein
MSTTWARRSQPPHGANLNQTTPVRNEPNRTKPNQTKLDERDYYLGKKEPTSSRCKSKPNHTGAVCNKPSQTKPSLMSVITGTTWAKMSRPPHVAPCTCSSSWLIRLSSRSKKFEIFVTSLPIPTLENGQKTSCI